ncbi:MAG TPA: hypothetical protein VI078_01730 [bacterium]
MRRLPWPVVYGGAVALFFTSVKLFDPDLWWHLASGRLILARGLPTMNTFSHTWPNYPWRITEWAFDALLALADRALGLTGVELVPAVLVAAAFLLTWDTIRRRCAGATPAAFHLLLPLAAAASWYRFTPRPHLVTYVGLALLLNLRERRLRRPALALFVVACVWANCHSGVVFGAAAAMLVALATLLQGERDRARREAVAAAAFLAGSLVNPNGWYPYQDAVFHLGVTSVLPLNEFRRANLHDDPFFFLLAAMAIAAIPAHWKRRRFLDPLLVVAFLPVAIFAMRVIPKFAMVALPGLIQALEEARLGLQARRRGATAAAALCLLGVVSASAVALEARSVFVINRFGWGVNWKHLPEGAARFVEDNDLAGKMYNDFAQGGYLIWRLWPRRPVFQDGRVPFYPPAFFREILDAFGDPRGGPWQALMDHYQVEYAIVDRMPFGDGLDAGSRFAAIGWVPVYMDGVSYVYLRPSSLNRDVEREHGLMYLGYRESPEDLFLAGQVAPEEVRREVAGIDPGRLILLEDFRGLTMAALGAGDTALAARFLSEGMRQYPSDPFLGSVAQRLAARPERRPPPAR